MVVPTHRNNFGLLRLTFALLVIVSHSFELADGNRSRDPLTMLFGTLSFGELAVDGFFIISGYLVLQSLENSSSVLAYLRKRMLRIYPGYCVAYALCIFLVAPLAGANIPALLGSLARLPANMALLKIPEVPNTFIGLPHPLLNGSMWTIAYEFRCYLVLIVLALIGVFRVGTIALLFAATLVLSILFSAPGTFLSRAMSHVFGSDVVVGQPEIALRLGTMFFVGATYYAVRGKIAFCPKYGVGAAAVLIAALFSRRVAEPAIAVFGSYLIFWFSFLPGASALNRINNKTDLSYGTTSTRGRFRTC
jgi:peptidoglycan/LPS O-acetylase OafA/YrhL